MEPKKPSVKKDREREREKEQEKKILLQYHINTDSKISSNEQPMFQLNNERNVNLTISSPISGVMLMLLLLILRASDVDARSDLYIIESRMYEQFSAHNHTQLIQICRLRCKNGRTKSKLR